MPDEQPDSKRRKVEERKQECDKQVQLSPVTGQNQQGFRGLRDRTPSVDEDGWTVNKL